MLSRNICKVFNYLNKQQNIKCNQLISLLHYTEVNDFSKQCIQNRKCSTDTSAIQQRRPANGTIQQQSTDSSDDITDDFVGSTAYNESQTIQNELKISKNNAKKALRRKLEIGETNADRIIRSNPEIKTKAAKNVSDVVDYLIENGATEESLIENVWIVSYTHKLITVKLPILQRMKPRDINDFIPLLKVNLPTLIQLRKLSQFEEPFMPGGHRIYFLSDKLNVEPKLVAKYLSTHMFMFNIPFENLTDNLDVMLKYKVAPINILRDLWAFRYTSKSIDLRLSRAMSGQKDKLMPWMVRCSENILAKSIQISVDVKNVLGNDTLDEYIANRLNYDVQTTKFILQKHPPVYNVRVTKIKQIIDYLLNEADFTVHDIAQVPRILCHSLETTRHRLDELKSYGCKPTSLVVVCKSVTEYQKFLNNWLKIRNRMKKPEENSQTVS